MTVKRRVVYPENMDTAKGLPYDEGTKKYYVDPNPLVDGATITTTGRAPNRKITLNPEGFALFAGKAMEYNPRTKKLDVKHDSTLFINGSNQLGLNPTVLEELEDRLQAIAEEVKSQDKLLEKVEYKQDTKELWFYVGSPRRDGDETILKVNVADLLPVISAQGITGSGTQNNPLKVKIDPTSNGLTQSDAGLKVTIPEPIQSEDASNYYITWGGTRITIPKGISCETFGQLPKATWEDGMAVLAKRKTGQCVRLVPADSIFQTVGISVVGYKTDTQGNQVNTITGFTDEIYYLVYRVSNSGEDTSTTGTFTISTPKGDTSYTIQQVTEQKSLATFTKRGNPANRDDLVYTYANLQKGGWIEVVLKITGNSNKSYQFGARVEPDPNLVNKATNTSVTSTLNVNLRQDPNLVVNADCPLIIGTAYTKRLVQTVSNTGQTEFNANLERWERKNIILDPHLTRLDAVFTNASTVHVKTFTASKYKYDQQRQTTWFGSNWRLDANSWSMGGSDIAAHRSLINATSQINPNKTVPLSMYTFNPANGQFSLDLTQINKSTSENTHIAVWCRPQGQNCRWQLFVFTLAYPQSYRQATRNMTLSGLPNNLFEVTSIQRDELGDDPNEDKNYYPLNNSNIDWGSSIFVTGTLPQSYTKVGDVSGQKVTQHTATVNLQAGTARNFTVDVSGYPENFWDGYETNGKTIITKVSNTQVRVTVAANAKATDSINLPYLKVNITE